MKQDGTLGKMLPVIKIRLKYFLQEYQKYVWYQGDISLTEHRLVGSFQIRATGRDKSKYPNVIEEKHWKELEK